MALWRSSGSSRSAPPAFLKLFHLMFFRKSRSFTLTLLSFILICFGCSQDTIQDEAIEILSVDNENAESYIEKSADGLQFTNTNNNSDKKSTVGFSREGEITYKGDLKNGQPHGLWTTFFPDGKPRWQGYKKNGVNHGSFTMWYENGKKRIEGSYENGLKKGRSISWHPNGAKWQQKSYESGNPVGTWKTWDESGKLISEVSHEKISVQEPSDTMPD